MINLHINPSFLCSVDNVTIQMRVAMDSVAEAGIEIDVCAEIEALPAGGLQTDLVVTLSTMDGAKAGLQC